jgi:hypothetical protein
MLQWPISIAAARRHMPLLLVFLLVLSAGATPAHGQSEPDPALPATEALASPIWAVALEPATLRSKPDEAGDVF